MRTVWRLPALACTLACCVTGVAPAQQAGPIRFDNWLYFQRNTDGSERWQYRPRFYVPFRLPAGWTFTQRIDLPVYYTDKVGPDNPDGVWKAGIGDWFVEEIFASPEVAPNLALAASVRFVFPTGGSSPFGSNQYQWAPMVGARYALPEHRITLYPHARYFMSYHATEPGAQKIRQLNLYPTIQFGLAGGWTFALYAQNPISYDEVSRAWFVPASVTLTRRLTKAMEISFGGAYALVKDDPSYQYVVRGRLTFYF